MEQKIGEVMAKHTDFFRNVVMISSFLIVITSCDNKEQTLANEKYYNFFCDTIKTDSSLQINSRFGKLESNEPYYTVEIKNGDNKVLKSLFIFNRIVYETSSFKNYKGYEFTYSIMPKYTDSNLVAQKINYGNSFVYLIKGENPYCNGTNCRSYNLHLLAIKSNKLKLNWVYQFDDSDNKFEDFRIVLANDKLILQNKNKVIDTLRF